MKNKFIFIFCIFFSILNLYYISINTFLKDRVLPFVKTEGIDLSLLKENEVKNKLRTKKFTENKFINISINGYKFKIPISNLDLKPQTHKVIAFGKGKNYFYVIGNIFSIVRGKNLQIEYDANILPIIDNEYLINKSNDEIINYNGVQIDCSKYKKLSINKENILKKLNESIRNDITLNLSLEDIIEDKDKDLYKICFEFSFEKNMIEKALDKTNIRNPYSFYDLFNYSIINGEIKWNTETKNLENLLKLYKIQNDTEAFNGEFVDLKDQIGLIEDPRNGKKLDIENSKILINNWLKDVNDNLPLFFNIIEYEKQVFQKPVVDFTNNIASGRTRIDLIRDGRINYRVATAQAGIEEMHLQLIKPQTEFSFLKRLNLVDGGYTANGRFIGGGVCNATTTLFRAVLEAGFPITERHYHTFYVKSYEWGGYELNIVDAAYYNGKTHIQDFKFINDLDYPVLLKSQIIKANDGFQYHVINILTNRHAPKRHIELTNFKKWNIKTNFNFSASFERFVYEGPKLIRNDKFYNYYVN